MSELKTNKVSPATGTALAVGDSGDTITVPSGATLDISASTLTPPATMPASSGINFTALNATNLGSGTVPTARLGSGTADATTFLKGDQTYASAGKINQVLQYVENGTQTSTTTSFVDLTDMTLAITPTATDSKIMVMFNGTFGMSSNYTYFIRLVQLIAGGSDVYPYVGDAGTPPNRATLGHFFVKVDHERDYNGRSFQFVDSPATTSAVTYRIQWMTEGGTMYLGRSGQDSNFNYHARVPAALQLWEILA